MRVALALGSGGARGYAHIGVIDELLARGHKIVAVSGTSMGALVGGLHAAGKLEDFTDWATGLNQRDVLRLLDPAFRGAGAIRAEKVMEQVADILGEIYIEDLPIPFTAVATDLTNQREVWFHEGPVAMAVRASIAIPSAITPVVLNGRLLADGGLLNPVPVSALHGVPEADRIVAVDLNAHRANVVEHPAHETAHQPEGEEQATTLERVRRGAVHMLDAAVARALAARIPSLRPSPGAEVPIEAQGEPVFDDPPRELKAGDVFSLSFDAASALITRFRMAANPPDALVSVPTDVASTFDFHRARELIDTGRELAVPVLDRAGL